MDFSTIEIEALALLEAPGEASDRLQALCDLMKRRVPRYDWFGFYVARRTEAFLDLGPFVGEATEHTLIPFGRGICGQAAERGDTFIVDDVSGASNYLACSLKVKSEIVVPVFAPKTGGSAAGLGAAVAGEIDIDSHTVAAFGPEDRVFLERLARRVAADVEALRR